MRARSSSPATHHAAHDDVEGLDLVLARVVKKGVSTWHRDVYKPSASYSAPIDILMTR